VQKWESCTDAELLAAKSADPDAFAVFYKRHIGSVLNLVQPRARRRDDVGDLVAEVFATALVYRSRYEPARGSARAWLAGIALNKLADANRKGVVEARMCRRLGMLLPRLGADEMTLDDKAVWLAPLAETERRAVEARVLQDKSYEQIADEHGVTAEAARKRVSRALTALRSRFQAEH
jgi:DNA-directed RNA polymerase specialized sigma24 family protein